MNSTTGRMYHFNFADHKVLSYWIEVLTASCPLLARERKGSIVDASVTLGLFGSIASHSVADKGKEDEERRKAIKSARFAPHNGTTTAAVGGGSKEGGGKDPSPAEIYIYKRPRVEKLRNEGQCFVFI